MYKHMKINFTMILLFVILVSGCAKVDPAEEIYNHLEKAVSLEAVFEKQQKPLR
ncbi:hypothetical protein KHA80_18795 [Anaerobacillus sp. HL2]|nr:hypothetical protein KHA80_18795 [Anaerobacillus sp. HL2]